MNFAVYDARLLRQRINCSFYHLWHLLPSLLPAVRSTISGDHSINGNDASVRLKYGSSFLVESLFDTSDTPDFLVTFQRYPREDVRTMLRGKLLLWDFLFTEFVPVLYNQRGSGTACTLLPSNLRRSLEKLET